jgi:hypothetical protein
MTTKQLFTNNAVSLLNASIGPTDTTLVVQSGLGALFPQPTNPGDFFLVTLESTSGPIVREILYVTGRSGDTFTGITRGWEGTGVGDGQPGVGLSWTALDTLVDHRVTAYTMAQAMVLPASSGGGTPAGTTGQVQVNNAGAFGAVPDGTSGQFLQSSGPGVPPTWVSGGTGGVVNASVNVNPTTTQTTAQQGYTNTSRLFKFWVQMYDTITYAAQVFEVLVVVEGQLNGSETYDYTVNNQIGTLLAGNILIDLDTVAKNVSLNWQNLNSNPVVVTITSL